MNDNAVWRLSRRDTMRWAAILPLLGVACPVFASLGGGEQGDMGASGDNAIRAAFHYAFPLYEFARTEQTLTKCVGGSGEIGKVTRRNQLTNHKARNVTAPNNDTVYCSAFLELSAGPVEILCPDITDRYFSIEFMDAFTDNFAYIGTRATGGKGGSFWVAGPQWKGRVPTGSRLFRSSTNDVWMLARILIDGPADLADVAILQDQIGVVIPEGRPPARGYTHAAVPEPSDPANFLAVVNEVLSRSPGGKGQTARATRFRSLGIGTDAAPSSALLDRWAQFIPIGFKELREGFLFRDLVFGGWSYQPRGVGDFGRNDRLRAIVTLGGIAPNIEQEAMYFHANFDTNGERLSGRNAYRWRLPPGGVPASAFWSLTIYDALPDGRYFLVDNPIGRYSIGDRTAGLIYEPDGSLEILIQHDQPTGRLAPNWLPAPEGSLRLALRAYLPKPVLIERKWRVPPLVKAQPA